MNRTHVVAIVLVGVLCAAIAVRLAWRSKGPIELASDSPPPTEEKRELAEPPPSPPQPATSPLSNTQATPQAPATPPAHSPSAPSLPPKTTFDANSCIGPRGERHTFPLNIFDENADGDTTIRDAAARARAENKRVLVMWGDNMNQFCLFLEDILANDPLCKPLVQDDFVRVQVDLGRGFLRGDIKNRALAESFGLTHLQTLRPEGKTMGNPMLCIIDPETGKTVGEMDSLRGYLTGVMGGNDMLAKPLTMQRIFDEKIIYQYLITHRPPSGKK